MSELFTGIAIGVGVSIIAAGVAIATQWVRGNLKANQKNTVIEALKEYDASVSVDPTGKTQIK